MTPRGRSSAGVLLLAYLAFVSLGLPDAVLGVAWPSIRSTFGLAQALLGAPLAIAAVAYFVSGLFAGRLLERLGVGALLAASTWLVVLGLFVYAAAPSFFVILGVAPLVGFGSGAIDAALNTYAAKSFSAKHMSWLHAAYAAGAAAGPALMTAVLTRGATWRIGYAVLGGTLAVLALGFTFTRSRWKEGSEADGVVLDAPGAVGPLELEQPPISLFSVLRNGKVWLQIGLFFVYTGTEITAGQWSYTLLTEDRGFTASMAGTWVSIFWGGLLVGRLLLGFVVERLGSVRLLRLATGGAVLSALLFAIPGLSWGVIALPLLGFCLASIYPGLMSETPRRLGEKTAAHAVGFQVSAATVGVAVLPSAAGLLSERLGLEVIGVFIACCTLAMLMLHEVLVRVADRASPPSPRPSP